MDISLYPDYPSIITSPIDLKSIRKKLNSGLYPSIQAFKQDIDLMWMNCKRYTSDPEASVRVQCMEMEEKFEQKWSVFEAKFGGMPGKCEAETAQPRKKRKKEEIKTVVKVEKEVKVTEIMHEDELNLDEGAVKFQNVIKFAVPLLPSEHKIVLIPAEPAIKKETPCVESHLPSSEEYIQAVQKVWMSSEVMERWKGKIEEVWRRYGYEGVRGTT